MNCKACFHPERDKIDADLVAGVPVRTICASTGLSLGGLTRHKEHIRTEIKKAYQARESERSEHSGELLTRVNDLIAATQKLLDESNEAKDRRTAISAIGALTRLLELYGKSTGELSSGGLNLTLNRVTHNTLNIGVDDDPELAALVAEATNGFDPGEIDRLKLLAARGDWSSSDEH